MNMLEIIRVRIIKDFPQITSDELHSRLKMTKEFLSEDSSKELFSVDYNEVLIIRDPIALAIYIYRQGQESVEHPQSVLSLCKEIKYMADHFNLTEQEVRRGVNYLENLELI